MSVHVGACTYVGGVNTCCKYVGSVNTCWWYVSMWVVSSHVDGVYVW